MIYLKKPYIKENKNKSRLIFDIKIDNEEKKVWFEVNSEYTKYLCDDRVDAIVVGLLSYAMRNNHNIESDSFITEEILFKIKNYLIPSLSKYSDKLFNIQIKIKTKPTIPNAGAVGTGCSCGVDSIHAYLNHYNEKDSQFKLTHLCINNVGAFNETYKDEGIAKVKKEIYRKSKLFAQKVNLPLIETDSNFLDEIYQCHLYTHTYSSCFAILCMQKLWKTYYYGSSGYDLSSFNVVDSSNKDCALYELLSLNCFSTNNLKIYSDGGEKTRIEKTKQIYKHELTKQFLHVCLKKGYNCSVCEKCMRTILTLYALNSNMNDYNNIFDINYFNNHKEEYFEWIYKEHLWNDKSMNEPTYKILLAKKDFKKFVEKYDEKHNIVANREIVEEIDFQKEYEKVINSKTFKVGNLIMFIPRKIKNIFRK